MASKSTKKTKFIAALELLEQERGIEKEAVIDALKEALEKSYKKNYLGPESIVKVDIDASTGIIKLFEIKHVVDDVMDEDYELSEEEAQEIDPKYKVGDDVITEVSPDVFGRLAAIQTKQLLRQKIRENEKEALFNEYIDKKDDIITGVVDRVEDRFAIINIGKTGALLPMNAQIPGEKLFEGQHLKVYVDDVERGTKGTHIGVSRTEPGLVKRLFEMEVPEIYDGTVEIKSVSREAGERSKIAVYTASEDIDPIGSCVGPKGTRVRNVVNELNGEMIDIVEWSENPVTFISNALSPAKVVSVKLNATENSALVIVPDNQLSLAIGKRGQNARLAVRLTGWKIDIKSEAEATSEGISVEETEALDHELLEEMMQENKDNDLAEDINEESFDEEKADEIIEEDVQEQVEEEAEVQHTVEEETKPVVAETEEIKEEKVEKTESDDEEEEDEEPAYDPKYDEDIDYDEFDKYYED